MCVISCSIMSNSVAPWTVACQDPLSMEFSNQEYWSQLPFPPRGDLPNPGTEPVSCVFTTSTTWEALASIKLHILLKKNLNLLFAFIPSSYFLFYIWFIYIFFFFLIGLTKSMSSLLILKSLEFNYCRFCLFLKFLLILSIFFLLIFELLFYSFSNFFVSIA